jgi:ankyrin repeat protein
MSARGHAEPRTRFLSEARHHRQNAAGVWPRRHWKKVGQVLAVVAISSTAWAEPSPLITAARNADAALVRALLQKKADVNAAEGDGATALHWASYHDSGEVADLLLRAGANVNAANDLGATPLWLAAQNGSAAMARRLLQAGANPNKALLAGETPLMVAARAGSAEVVELLAAKGADLNARATRGQTALMWAVSQKHPAVVKILIARGADIHARSDEWGQVMAVFPHGLLDYNRPIPHGRDTALLFAARVGDLESARLLVGAGANVNDEDAWGVSATTLAAHSGFGDLVAFLLEKGATPNAARAGFTALHEAVMRRDPKIAATLLAHGADPNARLGAWTPMRRSSRDWNFAPELVGATPFWLAARFAQPDLMRLLADRGADPLFVHQASYHAGDPAEPRRDRATALMAAVGMVGGAGAEGGARAWVRPARVEAEARVLEAVKLALDLGVDPNAANLDGRTALDAARALKYQSVVAFLSERGAKSGKP